MRQLIIEWVSGVVFYCLTVRRLIGVYTVCTVATNGMLGTSGSEMFLRSSSENNICKIVVCIRISALSFMSQVGRDSNRVISPVKGFKLLSDIIIVYVKP